MNLFSIVINIFPIIIVITKVSIYNLLTWCEDIFSIV